MKNAWFALSSAVAVAIALLTSTSAVRADAACPTTSDSVNAVLHIDAFNPLANGNFYYTIGNFNFFGSSVVGTCILDRIAGTETLHVIVDANNNLLGWLPKPFSHLCLSPRPDETFVVQAPLTACGITINPLNYAGNTLVQYGIGSNDILRGGNGADTIYGGVGNDSITDAFNVSSNPIYLGTLLGESGDDRLFGSQASFTQLEGGEGADGLWDIGGNGDTLSGGNGNECCMFDSNENFSLFDCGAGTDRVRTTGASKTSCEIADPTCTQVTQNSACFPH